MTADEIQTALAGLFSLDKLGWKPQAVKGNRAMACCYIDARDVMDRLDSVVGVGAWQDEYQVLPDGSVMCHLRVRINGEWITKSDVGGMSEQPDGGDRLKAAFSDALKRTAVKFGIGRYLYSLPAVWCDYDPTKKQFIGTPSLPPWAMPGGGGKLPTSARQPAPQQQRAHNAPASAVKRPTNEELKSLLTSRGWAWKPAVHAINVAEGSDYLESHLPDDIMTEHLARFCDHLRGLPEKQPAGGK